MATNFPTTLDSYTTLVDNVDDVLAAHANDRGDAIEALEAKVGIDSSAVATAIDYFLKHASGNFRTHKHLGGANDGANIGTTGLKTAAGEVNTGAGGNFVLPGGEYGFYPQIKTAGAGGINFNLSQGYPSYAYVTIINQNVGDGGYAQQTYITSSGEDWWLFLLIDKNTKDIIGGYSAPDHPAYGNGGDFNKIPHPFGSYNATKHEIVLVDNDTIAELKTQVTQEKSLLTLINEEYKLNMAKEEAYKPLHSGRFIDKKPELVQAIPDYIKVRKLNKLTQTEKDAREVIRQQRAKEAEEKRQLEDLIEAKKRELAIAELKKEGKLK